MSGRVLLLLALPVAGAVAWLAVRERMPAPPIAPGAAPIAPPAGQDEAPAVDVAIVAAPDVSALLAQWGSSVAAAARRVFQLPASAARYAETIAAAEHSYGLPPSLLARVLYQESRYRPEVIDGRKKSPAGAVGIAQFMPATAAEWNVNPLDPSSAIPGAARYLRWLYDQLGDWGRALAAYNWGIGNVTRRGLAAAPAETQAYVRDILADVDVT